LLFAVIQMGPNTCIGTTC